MVFNFYQVIKDLFILVIANTCSLAHTHAILLKYYNYTGIKRYFVDTCYVLYLSTFSVYFSFACYIQVLMSRKKFGSFESTSPLIFYLFHEFIQQNSIALLAGLLFMSHTINAIHFGFYMLIPSFEQDVTDWTTLARALIELEFTVFHRMWKRYSERKSAQIKALLAKIFSPRLNPFCSTSEKLKLLELFRFCEIAHFLSVSLTFVSMCIISLIGIVTFLNIIFVYGKGPKNAPESIFVLIGGALIVSLGFLGLTFSILLSLLLVIFLVTIMITWRRYCRRFRAFHVHLSAKKALTEQHFCAVFKQVKHGQRLFVSALAGMRKVNKDAVGKVFTISVCLTLIANVICVMELILGTLHPRMKRIMLLAVIVQLLVIFFVVLALLQSSQRLYQLNKLFLHYRIRFAMHKFKPGSALFRIRSLLRWTLFMEVLQTRKFSFSLACLSKVTSGNIVKFIPLYSSLIFYLCPMVAEQKASIVE